MGSGLGLREIWRGSRSGQFLQRLASFSRLILFDGRGNGLSDHILDSEQQLTLEARMEDVRAVMDAAGSRRAVLFGLEGGFSVAAMFAATLPDRTVGLIAYGAMARELWAPDYPFGFTLEESDADIAEIERAWATDELAQAWLEAKHPTARNDVAEIEEFAAYMGGLGGPGDVARSARIERDTDLRDLLPSIRVPTLVIHRQGDRAVPIEHGRYLARHLPGAELSELPGDVHMWDVGNDLPAEVQRFVTTLEEEQIELDCYLATVLFTDIVDSTAVATAADDRGWAPLERHHELVRGQLARYRCTEMDTAGDGFFATFDGPARAVRCALTDRGKPSGAVIGIRAGISHGGKCRQ